MYIQGMIIIEDSVLVKSFGWVTVPLKIKLPVMSHFMCIANCTAHYVIHVACEAIPLEHDTGNLRLGGTVHVHAQLVIIKIIKFRGIPSGGESMKMLYHP